jgi:aminoglycoside 6'-N-acetyltransferase I
MREVLWPGAPAEHEQEIRRFFAERDPNVAALVAERPNGGLGGFVEIGPPSYAEGCTRSPVAYVEGWYVDPDLRRRGVGRELIRAAEIWARANGYGEIASDAEIENVPSRRAHRALGYEEAAQLFCFRKELEEPPGSV